MFFFASLIKSAFQSQFATSYSTITPYVNSKVLSLTVVDNYPVIKLVPLDPR